MATTGFATASGKPIAIAAAPSTQPRFETSFPPAPAALQDCLDAFSLAGPSTFADIIAELDYAGARFISDQRDFYRLDALLGGPVDERLGDWQAEVKLEHWDASVERRLILGGGQQQQPQQPTTIKRLYYCISTACGSVLLRRQTPPSRVGLSPALTMLAAFFRRAGLRCFARQPSEDPSQPDKHMDVLTGVAPHMPPFTVKELFVLVDSSQDPQRELECTFFGGPLDRLVLPAGLFVVLRGLEEEPYGATRIAVWLFRDEHAELNLARMDAARYSDTALLNIKATLEEQQQQQQQESISATAPDTQQQSSQSVIPATPMLESPAAAAPVSPVAPPSLPAPFGLFGGAKRQRL
jgi:hypothetical protein